MLQACTIARDVAEHASSQAFVRGAMAAPGTCAASPAPSLLDHLQQHPQHPANDPEAKAYRTLTPRSCAPRSSSALATNNGAMRCMHDIAACTGRGIQIVVDQWLPQHNSGVSRMRREDDITADAAVARPQIAFEISPEQAQNYQDLRVWVGNGSGYVSAFPAEVTHLRDSNHKYHVFA